MTARSAELPLAVVGCDFRVAPSRLRSLLVLDDAEALRLFAELQKNGSADGFADLNTCNRNEWIVSSRDPRWAAELLRSRMMERLASRSCPPVQLYLLVGREAAEHAYRVAIGQESLVQGERQIAGQLFDALEAARARGTSSRILNGLGAIAGRLVNVALRTGCIAGPSRGVHSLAVSFLRDRFDGDGQIRVAVVGLGSVGRRVLGLLDDDPRFVPIPCNRTVQDAERGHVRPLSGLASVLGEADAAAVCTCAPRPVVGPASVGPRDPVRPLLLLDLGIPEQVERDGMPENVVCAGLDDLTALWTARGDGGASPAGDAAEKLVRRAVAEFARYCAESAYARILDSVQRSQRRIVDEEIPRLVTFHLASAPEDLRRHLEADLRETVLGCTHEIFESIRESSRHRAEGEEWPEPL